MDTLKRCSKLRFAFAALMFIGSASVLITPAYADSRQKPNGQQAGNAQQKTPADSQKQDKKSGKKAGANNTSGCDSKMPVHQFVVDSSGAVNDSGRTLEGPLCVKVFYNPIQSYVSLASTTTTTNGPDLNKVVTGASAQGGAPPAEAKARNISMVFQNLQNRERLLSGALQAMKSSYGTALQGQEQAIAKISLLRRTTKLLSASQLPDAVKNGYEGLQGDLKNAASGTAAFVASDQPGPQQATLLSQFEAISDTLSRLPLTFSNRPSLQPSASQRRVVCSSEPLPADMKNFDPQKQEDRDLAFNDWIGQCKTDFDNFKSLVDGEIQEAKNYTMSSDKVKELKSEAAIVQYWDSLFTNIGLRTDMSKAQIEAQDISGSFYAYTGVKCGILFNQTSNTAVNLVAADLGPTLEGKDPEIKAQGAFVTVSCGSPFSISAGIAFSTIPQQEFAIIKSSGGAGNPSINTFGVVNDASITPLPMVMANVRLWDSPGHKYAFHGSFGIGGNLQNQASGGSSADFLPAASVSFWRTMYVSFGPEIGTKSQLAGNFKVGDVVPSDITTIQGQVKRTRTVGFGFAITFTKP